MKTAAVLIALVALAAVAHAEIYFKETFDGNWEDRWTISDWKKGADAGKLDVVAGPWYGDAEEDKGLHTTTDARFYAASAKHEKFSNKGKTLVMQFQVRFPQKIDCGGGYLKYLPSTTDQKNFNGDSEYNVMFGPDVCGTSTKRVHVIFNYKGKNLLTKKTIPCETDQLSHVYTLIVNPDDTYEVRVDGVKKEGGSVFDDWDFLLPKKIKDPKVSKPSDWVDKQKIDDPEDKKPEDYDSIPKEIPDPEAQQPEDWDEEADGPYEPPMVPNPEFKGEWKAKQIDNPDYKGPWVHPEIDNPDYVDDKGVTQYDDFGVVGFDVWQVKAGTIVDNIIITDSVAEAEQFMKDTFQKNKDGEKKMFDEVESKKREEEEAERKRVEEERKKADEAKKDDDDDDDDDDDEDEKKDLGDKLKAAKEDL